MQTGLAALLVFTITAPTAAQTAAGSEEAAIRRVVQQHDDARNRGDWKGVGQLFTDNADQLTSSGEWRRGRGQIEKGSEQATTTTYKGGKYVTKVEAVRTITPDVAIADAAFEIQGIAGGSRKGHTTYVLVKTGGAWRIAATRSMVPTPLGATPSR